MTTPTLPPNDFMQMCWVVPDLRLAIDAWAQTSAVGPFFWFDAVPFTNGHHRGVPAEFPPVTAAIAYAGDLQIELVQQDGDEPGVFRDTFGPGEYGLHHLAVVCTDYEAERDAYLAAGADLAFEGEVESSRTCWVDTSDSLGVMVELLEPSEMRTRWFAHMRAAAADWDGERAVVGGPRAPRDH